MAKSTIQLISETRQLLAKLEQKLHAELAKLPAKFEFKSAEEFLAAFKAATGEKGGGKVAAKKSGGRKRKARVEITDEIVEKVGKLAKDGKTGSEIASAVGISLPSVQNIKKKLGLVKKRSK